MKRVALILVFLLGSVLLVPATASLFAMEGWLTDYAAAQKRATDEKKDLLLFFTGSDWCPPCKALVEKIFSRDDFAKQMAPHFVLVELDYPRDKSGQAKELVQQNEQLKTRFKITAYPTVILATAKGLSYRRIRGFNGQLAVPYMADLLSARGMRLSMPIKLDPRLTPPPPADEQAFIDLSRKINLRRIQHILLCDGSEEGLVAIRTFLEKYPDSEFHDEVLYLQAVSLWTAQDYAAAAPAFTEYLETYPDTRLTSLATTRHVQSLLRSDQPARCLVALDRIGPSQNATHLEVRAQALSITGRTPEAIALIEKWLADESRSEQLRRADRRVRFQLEQLRLIGKPLPAFSVDKYGTDEKISPASLRGKVVLVDVWASWCRPCLVDLPHIKQLYENQKGRGFEILGVSLDKEREPLDKALREHGIRWPQYYDGKFWKNDLAVMFKVHWVPYCLLVDREGTVRYVGLRGTMLDRLTSELIAEQRK